MLINLHDAGLILGKSSSVLGTSASHRDGNSKSTSKSLASSKNSSKNASSSSRDPDLPSYPATRESLGRFSVFETNINKLYMEGLFKSKSAKWRRRNLLFTSTKPLLFSSSSAVMEPMKILPQACVHVLKEEKEAERLRITSRSTLSVVDKGIHGPGSRFHLSIVGQVPGGSPPVAEWVFGIDHYQEVRYMHDLIQVSDGLAQLIAAWISLTLPRLHTDSHQLSQDV
jgi:hypothetical protein